MKRTIITKFVSTILAIIFVFSHTNISIHAQGNTGNDTRSKLTLGNSYVARVVVDITDTDFNFGTGTLVGRNKILTAAHVAYKISNKANARVYLGQHNNGLYQTYNVTDIKIHPSYNPTSNTDRERYDLAVLTIDSNFSTYHFIKEFIPNLSIFQDTFRWIGYPADLISFDNFNIAQYITIASPLQYNATNKVLLFNQVSFSGQSGSALIEDYSGFVYGVLYGGPSGQTGFTMLTDTNYKFVYDAIRN